jgi:hypothetical protein
LKKERRSGPMSNIEPVPPRMGFDTAPFKTIQTI